MSVSVLAPPPAPASATPSAVRACLRFAAFVVINLLLVPCGWVASRLRRDGADRWTGRYCRAVMRLLGLRVTLTGSPVPNGPALLVANHISYFDIVALNSVTPLTFVAKAEVAGWPVFGWLATLARTAYVRRVAGDAKTQQGPLLARLQAGDRLVVFAEGTSSDGSTVLPFKSSLLALAEQMRSNTAFVVQPVTVQYDRLADGAVIDGPLRGLYGWYGDAEFGRHLKRAFGLAGAHLRITFHPPIRAEQIQDRKDLTRTCEAIIRAGLILSDENPAERHKNT